jgi:hypothetical protein
MRRKMSAQARRIEFIKCVNSKAEAYDRQGYSVKANVSGWSKPPTIEGLIPDIRATRGNQVIIGKMLREEDLGAAEMEYGKLSEYAGRDENTSFRVYLTSEDGKPRLHKIY